MSEKDSAESTDSTIEWAGADCRLAVYGTLAPGRANHHHVAELAGTWVDGHVRGRLVEAGWGAAMGYPGLVLDDAGDTIEVQILISAELPEHWHRLDGFEGPGYLRRVTHCAVTNGIVAANIYTLAQG